MHSRVPLFVAFGSIVLFGAHPTGQPPTGAAADVLARQLQAKYDGIRDFSADFVHTYEGGVIRRKAVERGTVMIKKPGRMRWSYTSPEEKLFVSDGRKIYSYIPADRQVIVSSMPADDQASTPILFLAGKGSLTRDFTASHTDLPGLGPGSSALKLVPNRASREYEWLIVVFDRQKLAITSLISADSQGGRSTFTFSNLKENVGLSDKPFAFQIPRGVDVITSSDVPS